MMSWAKAILGRALTEVKLALGGNDKGGTIKGER